MVLLTPCQITYIVGTDQEAIMAIIVYEIDHDVMANVVREGRMYDPIVQTVIEETRNMWGRQTVREDDIRTAEVSLDDGERGWVLILIGNKAQGYRVWGSCEGGPITSQDVADIMERGDTYDLKISGVWEG
jgi:hypothetical protein